MNHGDRGEAVRRLQLALLEKGFQLPRWGADGALGNETWDALQQAADRFGIDPLPEPAPGVAIYPDLIAAIMEPTTTGGRVCSLITWRGGAGLPRSLISEAYRWALSRQERYEVAAT